MHPQRWDDSRAIEQAQLFTRLTGVPCVVLDRTGRVRHPRDTTSYPCRLCRTVSGTDAREQTGARHLPWVEEAMRFGGRSIFLCTNAFTHWTAPLLEENRMVGALVAGPVLTVEEEGFFENELLAHYPGRRTEAATRDLRTLYHRVPRLPPAAVTTYSELLRELCRAASSDPSALDESEQSLRRESRINEYIQELKATRRQDGDDPEAPTYPVEKESLLLDQIRSGEISGAQKTLNELLSHVFFATGSEMDQIKVRSRELVVLLSRAVLTEGADPEEVFGLNYQFVHAIDHQSDINGVAYWMARIVRRFADLILYLPHLGHARALRRALSYVREHLDEPLRIADVAAVTEMSPSHFSRVFRDELGETFVSYLNRIRCERAAELLRATALPVQEIAHRCGFSDHSYFTKVFRSRTGAPPSTARRG